MFPLISSKPAASFRLKGELTSEIFFFKLYTLYYAAEKIKNNALYFKGNAFPIPKI